MNSREVVRRIRAFHAGKPLHRSETRHVHIAEDKDLLIVAFLRMGGESRPWGVAYGHAAKTPNVLTVPEGRNRDLVAGVMTKLAPTLLEHLQCPGFVRKAPDSAAGIAVVRQVWLPNPTHLDMLHHLAYAYTFTKWGEDKRERLNALGRACGWLFREAQRPGEQHVIVATEALRSAYTFPAEDVRQGHLGFLLAWLTTRGGRNKRLEAAIAAEKQAIATSLDPEIERGIEDEVGRWGQSLRADDSKGCARAAAAIDKVLRAELERRYNLTQSAISLLRSDKRRVNSGVSTLVRAALDEQWEQYLRIELKLDSEDDGPAFIPSPETDRHPAAAGSRYLVHEASSDLADFALLHDDVELQAEAIAAGDAFRGEVVDVRDEGPGKATVPLWTIRNAFSGPLRLRTGSSVCVLGLPKRTATVRRIDVDKDGALLMEVEITNLKTAAKEARGVHRLAPVDRAWIGESVTLITASAEGISRSKSFRIWKRDVPGAMAHARQAGGRSHARGSRGRRGRREVGRKPEPMTAGVGNAREAIARENERVFRKLREHISRRGQLAIVKAPPGSGKTYLLLQTVGSAFGEDMRVAIGAQTNAQADDICRRLARDYPKIPVYRFAAGSVAEADLGRTVHWIWETRELPTGPCVVVATTAKWGLVKLVQPFDYLFVDEAWQMGWADFMLCGQVAPRFVLIGDPGQIPPVVSIPVYRWETSPRAPHLPAPEVILDDSGIDCLKLQLPACRRLPADAVDLVRPFYDFSFGAWAFPGERCVKLKPNGGRKNRGDVALESLAEASVAAVTLPTPQEGPPFEQDVDIARLAAHIAVRLLKREAHVIEDETGVARSLGPGDIGLAATHRVMNAAMDQALPKELRGRVRVDTPERWQGLERGVMIIVHPLSGMINPTTFDLETGRLCVMASRHRSGMVVVSRDHLRQTLETHIPVAEQAVGRPDVSGRGHHQHLEFWSRLRAAGRVFSA